VDDLKRTVQRLEGTLDKLKDQFADTKPVSGPLGQAERPAEPKQAALAKPEPESVSLQKDLDVTLEPCPAPKTTLAPPPIIEPPKPAPPAKPTAIWATPKATVSHLAKRSRLPKVDAQSIEMKLGTYWFVRIGVMLVLTGLGFLAYYKRGFFIDLSPGAKVSLFYLLSAAMGGVGFWLQRTKKQLKNYG
jgi:uncharacterized membrane protein